MVLVVVVVVVVVCCTSILVGRCSCQDDFSLHPLYTCRRNPSPTRQSSSSPACVQQTAKSLKCCSVRSNSAWAEAPLSNLMLNLPIRSWSANSWMWLNVSTYRATIHYRQVSNVICWNVERLVEEIGAKWWSRSRRKDEVRPRTHTRERGVQTPFFHVNYNKLQFPIV